MLPVGLIKQEQPKVPHITWTDLVFRIASPKPHTKVATREAERCGGSSAVVSKLYPESSDCRLDKKNQKAKSSPLRMDCIREGVVGERLDSLPPKSHAVNPASAPKSVTVQENRVVRKILVDLRPILETVTEPCSSPQELPARADSPAEECLSSSAEDSSSEDVTAGGEESTVAPAVSSRDGGILKDVSLPPVVELGKASTLAAAKSPKGSQRLSETTQLQGTDLPPSPVLKPRIRTPFSLPKITPLQEVPLETDHSREPESTKLAAPSPDFQLPTQLFLQKLQETTTSKDHLLIAQALRRLRKELMADNPDLDDGDKSSHLPVLPRNNLWKSRTTDGRQKQLNSNPEAAKKRRPKLIWHISRVQPKANRQEIKQTRLFGSSKPGQAHSLPAEVAATPIRQALMNFDAKAAVK